MTTLANATTFSDNAVYAQVGMQVGPKKVARLARKMGIRTPVSSNFAMSLGGLRPGVTPLDMAHAYETFATGGKLVYGTLSPGQSEKSLPVPGPVGIERIDRVRGTKKELVELPDGQRMINRRKRRTVLKPEIAGQVSALLQTVVRSGTATRAQIPGVMIAGKTGTTENYGDAWFVGWTKEYTVAVWVGYPDEFKPMETEFQGEPVAGGTYPAGIWKTFMQYAAQVRPAAQEGRRGRDGQGHPDAHAGRGHHRPPAATAAPPAATAAPPTDDGTGGGTGGGTAPPAEQPPAEQPPAEQAPAEQPPAAAPETGGGEAAPPADGTTG